MEFFSSQERAVQQVVRDKDTILEGYVTEFLFAKQFLSGRQGSYTQGWWHSNDRGRRYFFVVKPVLNDIDVSFAKVVLQTAEVWQAWITDNGTWMLKQFLDSSATPELTESQFVAKCGVDSFRSGLLATSSVRDETRQNKCIAFFKKHDILTKVATERCFADDFLFKHFRSAVNVDFITVNKSGALCVLEVKFKFETRAGKFGVDSGQYHMLTELMGLGLQIHHIVLYNFTKKKDLTIFGFLATNHPSRHWKMCQLRPGHSAYETVAPSYTSIDGRKLQPYFALDGSVFERTVPFLVGDVSSDLTRGDVP